ncbi:MAG TPA: DUF1592 domain-containing protein [Polyangiaceae bacterium]|nr:DUF1592 domain-containing protein [Polyangiaceae bacterium]
MRERFEQQPSWSGKRLGWSLLALAAGGVLGACSSEAGNGSTSTPGLNDGMGANQPGAPSGVTPGNGQPSDPNSQLPGVTEPANPGVTDPNQDPAQNPNGTGPQDPSSAAQPEPQNPTVAPTTAMMADGSAVDCTMLQRPATPLRRLTRYEYNNSVRDLLGTTLTPADDFPPDEVASGFSNNALVLTVSSLHAEKYVDAAEAVAKDAVTNRLSTLVNCDTATTGEDACARSFAETFGRRAFRRTLTKDEVDSLLQAYTAGRTDGSFSEGIEVMIRAILQSPDFLYRVEFTGTETAGGGMVHVSGFETAARLSYLLWASTPSDDLLDAAEAGQLDTAEQVAAKAREMLQNDKAKPAIAEFFRQWFGLSRLDIVTKDADRFPLWSEDMRTAMRAEADAVLEHVVFGQNPTLNTLLTDPSGLPQGPLATLYGVDASDTVTALPPEQRSGVLTLPAFLAVQAHPDQTSPVLRGKFVRAQLLCDPPSPPPPNLNITPPDPNAVGTQRAKFTEHSKDPSCSGCHQMMDPIGYAFESYDALGNYRETDNGQTLDLTGTLVNTDIPDQFDGVKDLAQKLAASTQVRNCVATQWYRFAVGRADEGGDACSVSPLRDTFTTSDGNLIELLVGMTQTEAFLYRRASMPAAEAAQ